MWLNKLSQIFLTAVFVTTAGVAVVVAQDAAPEPADAVKKDACPNLFRELGLSPEQFQQLRKLNAARRPDMEAAQQRLRAANRALDAAIYADSPSDVDVHTKLSEFQQAQAEVARIRFDSELAIRRILTPEQLVKFRDLRQRFAKMKQDLDQGERGGRGLRLRRPRQSMPPPNDR